MLNTAVVASTPIKSVENELKNKPADTTIPTTSSLPGSADPKLDSGNTPSSSINTPNIFYTESSESEYSTVVKQVIQLSFFNISKVLFSKILKL